MNNTHPFSFELAQNWQEYDLLDSGDGKILERFGKKLLSRPYPQAFWAKSAPELWKQAHARFQADVHDFGGQWLTEDNAQKSWHLRWDKIRLQTQLGASQHTGIFPEEINQWLWLQKQIESAQKPVKLLNLWAYTGAINLVATQSGAEATHVDSSKHGIGWAMANQKLSNMKDAPIRYIQEDPLKFIKREARREKLYNALVFHFPRFETENESAYKDFLKQLPELLEAINAILDPCLQCLLVTAPTCIHPNTCHEIARALTNKPPQTEVIQSGQIASLEKSSGKTLPRASFSRWSARTNG